MKTGPNEKRRCTDKQIGLEGSSRRSGELFRFVRQLELHPDRNIASLVRVAQLLVECANLLTTATSSRITCKYSGPTEAVHAT